jgi:hypothetical protein
MSLPVLEVSDEIAARILKAFEGQTDDESGDDLSPEEAYLRWLRRMLLDKVVGVETQASVAALEKELE